MKKILLFASALAGLFLAGSCQRENLEPMESANTVTYTVTVPDALATKGIGDDISAVDELVYEVYRTQREGVETFTSVDNFLYHKTAPITNGVATIELEFVNNQNFTVLFWAHTKDNGVYDVDDLTYVTIESPDAANNFNAQAFVGRDFVRNCVSDANGKVTLTRPVSQLNIATTPESLGKFQDVIELKGSSVKVTGLATSYNIGTLSAFGDPATEYEYTETAVPEEALTVNGVGYTYVAMNYVGFAANDGSSDVTVSYVINTSEGNIENEIINVPFKPNFRTNIIGNLITSKTAYTIELDETWGDPDLAPDAIYMAAALGGEVTLTEDIVLTEPLEVKAQMTINLNGKTISGNYHKSAGAIIKNTGTLTITGGTISSTGENGGSAVQNNGTMTIERVILNGAPNANGSWPSYTVNNTGELTIIDSKITSHHGAVASYGEGAVVTLYDSEIDMAGIPGFTSHGIYTYDNGKVIVDGGIYANKATDQAASGASVINGAVEVKAGNFSGRIENYYGTPVLKGGSFSVKPNKNFIAAGYKVIEKDGKFYVVSEETDGIVSDKADLQQTLKDAVADGQTDIVIDAEGAEFDMNYGLSKANVPAGTTVTIRNANVNAKSYGNGVNGTVIFEDCNFNNANGAYSIHFDNGSGDVIFKNCALYGWNSFGSSLNSVSFENCTLNGNGIYALIRSYANLTLKDCTINTSNADHTDVYSEGVEAVSPATLTMENIEYVVYDENSLEFALENAAVSTIYLNPREDAYVADIYNGTAARKSLTIIGSEGTKFGHTATIGGQLRLELFERFTISNCEIIQRSGFKTWGHLVFSASGKENGVYTIKNCTFNSNGNQGIYINENTSGAVYNIENCTFNGNFGSADGAVTIQNNHGAAFTVNVNGCTFNTDSKEICYLYDDPAFTLNTDSTVAPICLYR